MVLQSLLRKVLPGKVDYGDTWFAMREKLLLVYQEAISSRCTRLVQMIQVLLIFLSSRFLVDFTSVLFELLLFALGYVII